jgi:hypothetical protein
MEQPSAKKTIGRSTNKFPVTISSFADNGFIELVSIKPNRRLIIL